MTSLSRGIRTFGVLLALACSRNEPAQRPEPAPPEPALLSTLEPAPITRVLPSEPGSTDRPAPSVAAQQEPAAAAAPAPQESAPAEKEPDVVYVPTPQPVVDKMLELAKVEKSDVVYDLGCGDGRIVVTAAKRYGARAYGFDIDPQRIKEARENVEKNGVGDLVTIEQKDIFELDLSPASVVTLYLLPELNVRLIPQLQKLKPGARVVSHDFDMEGVKPVAHVRLKPPVVSEAHQVFLWHAPIVRK